MIALNLNTMKMSLVAAAVVSLAACQNMSPSDRDMAQDAAGSAAGAAVGAEILGGTTGAAVGAAIGSAVTNEAQRR